MERNKIWHKITADINKKYSHLNTLTFEQCKKLCKYYKRKDPNNYGITLNLNQNNESYKEIEVNSDYVLSNVQSEETVDENSDANDVGDFSNDDPRKSSWLLLAFLLSPVAAKLHQ